MGKLDGRVAIVTAAAGAGIGQATARKLAQEGALVAVTDHHERRTLEVAEDMKRIYGEDRVIGIVCDVSNRSQVESMVQKVIQKWGKIDILVNNAGRNVLSPVEKMSDEIWELVIGVNLRGTFYCTRAVVPYMMERRYGRIISIASIEGWTGSVLGESHYAATKSGLMGFTKSLARELAPYNITVNAIAPGIIPNPFLEKIYGPMLKGVEKIVPLGRGGNPSEVANAVAFLASEEASYITGEILVVSGGLYMH